MTEINAHSDDARAPAARVAAPGFAYVATVHGDEAVTEALLSSVYDWDSWTPLLHPRFRRGGAYFQAKRAGTRIEVAA